MTDIQQASPDPNEPGYYSGPDSSDPYGGGLAVVTPAEGRSNLPRQAMIIGGATFAFTVIVIGLCYAIYNAARGPRDSAAVVPDGPGALQAAQNDNGHLLLYKPGDSWTFQFSKDDEEDSGPQSREAGRIVEKIIGDSIDGRSCLIETAQQDAQAADGSKISTSYLSCARQDPDRSLYLLAYGSNKPEDLHWKTDPELLDKGDWNVDPSFDTKTETVAGTPSHTFVTVAPDPVVIKLSTGTPVRCWRKTITVTAGDSYNETTTELYCPAIGQKISSTDTVIFPDTRTCITTVSLTHFSLVN